MTSYNTVLASHNATLPAWDGTGQYDPAAPPCSSDCAHPPAYNQNAVEYMTTPTGANREYIPQIIDGPHRSPRLPDGNWGSVLRTNQIRMTPYSVHTTKTSNFLVKRRMLYAVYGRLCKAHYSHRVSGSCSCSSICLRREAQKDHSWADIQGDYEYWNGEGVPTKTFSTISNADLVGAIAETRLDAINKSLRDYDALTDILQLKQNAREIKESMNAVSKLFSKLGDQINSVNRIAGRSWTAKTLLKASNKMLRKFGSAWLAYRYMIMPLLYSFHDVQKALSRAQITKDFAIKGFSPEPVDPGSLPSLYIRKDVSGSIKVRSTVVKRYTNASVALAARVGLNPFSTAWELIPFSFVVDWFLNIGDNITALTSADFADATLACTSTRRKIIETYTLVDNLTQTATQSSWGTSSLPCWPTADITALGPCTQTFSGAGDLGVLRTIEYDSYDRVLYSTAWRPNVRFLPYLNWKRYTDGVALAYNQMGRILRRL